MWLKILQEGQTAGFGPCFHFQGSILGTGYLSQSHIPTPTEMRKTATKQIQDEDCWVRANHASQAICHLVTKAGWNTLKLQAERSELQPRSHLLCPMLAFNGVGIIQILASKAGDVGAYLRPEANEGHLPARSTSAASAHLGLTGEEWSEQRRAMRRVKKRGDERSAELGRRGSW